MKKLLLFLCMVVIATSVMAQPNFAEKSHSLDFFLPETIQLNGKEVALEGRFDSAIPTPKQVLGFELGSRYCEWGDVIYYAETLARVSDRVKLVELGRSYECRRFIQLVISSPKNIANIEQIKADHLKLNDPSQSASLDTAQMPLITNITCSMHGNEASGVNAAVALAYFFAASEEKAIVDMLDNMVLLLVPGSNPDAINRFATWCNTMTGSMKSIDKSSREYKVTWPGARSNHYFADVNRDLLMCQHPEGRVGVSSFLDWNPNVVVDLHEHGSKKGMAFHSPGDPNRVHNYIPDENQSLTGEIGAYVGKAFKQSGANPYSGRGYDDFYLGKGAAYGDVHGAVCLLFEQPNTRIFQNTFEDGVKNISDIVRTQVFGSIAALCGGMDIRTKLLNYQREFYQKSAKTAQRESVKGYLFQAPKDSGRAYRLLENLYAHRVVVHHLATDVKVGKTTFKAGEAYVIPLESQPYFFKTKALWERLGIDSYTSTKFYDISTWTFPLAYNVEHADVTSVEGLLGERAELKFAEGVVDGKSESAYAFEATELYSANVIRALLLNNINVKIAKKPFKFDGKKMGYGSAVVDVAGQSVSPEKIYEVLVDAAKENGVDVYAAKGAFNSEKLNTENARMPKVALLCGSGVSSPTAGEVWKMLDREFGIAPTMMMTTNLDKAKFTKYNVVIAAGASMSRNSKGATNLRKWVENGGTLIQIQKGYKLSNSAGITKIESVAEADKSTKNKIAGMILNATIDNTSPLGYGYVGEELSIFKRGELVLAETEGAIVPVRYTKEPYLSGFISQENINRVASAPVAMVFKYGNGRVIVFADNITFRSYWYGATKLMMNAVYFGHMY